MNKLLSAEFSHDKLFCKGSLEIDGQEIVWSANVVDENGIQGICFPEDVEVFLTKSNIKAGDVVRILFAIRSGGQVSFPIDLKDRS